MEPEKPKEREARAVEDRTVQAVSARNHGEDLQTEDVEMKCIKGALERFKDWVMGFGFRGFFP